MAGEPARPTAAEPITLMIQAFGLGMTRARRASFYAIHPRHRNRTNHPDDAVENSGFGLSA